jgi:hypothetical protein
MYYNNNTDDNNIGPKTEPCGSPRLMAFNAEIFFP